MVKQECKLLNEKHEFRAHSRPAKASFGNEKPARTLIESVLLMQGNDLHLKEIPPPNKNKKTKWQEDTCQPHDIL